MKLFSMIKAFFTYRGQAAELSVNSAEVRQGKVYLHPADDPEHVYCVKTDAVDILISPHRELEEGDLDILPVKKDPTTQPKTPDEKSSKTRPSTPKAPKETTPGTSRLPAVKGHTTQQTDAGTPPTPDTASYKPKPLGFFMPAKKKLTISLYPDEYDALMETIQSNGYKKAEFLLACVESAKKNSMAANYKRFTDEHKDRHAADIVAAKLAQQEELLARKIQAALESVQQ